MSHSASFSRRTFLRGLGAGALALSVVRPGMADSGSNPLFRHGVASGDPLADRVVIWTRISPDSVGPVAVLWEVARDPDFSSILQAGQTRTHAGIDFTVKIDVEGLPAGARLFYRFNALGRHSPTGSTRTLPRGSVDEVRLAVFSCANYPAGYFHAYAEAARRSDIFASVHLGDYLYEYGRDGYASEDAATLGREVDPAGEILALDDYRRRYAQYRSDADLQALHAAMPMIAVWDDHEISNDTWREGAENHEPATEGPFVRRRAAALRAYHEWMPTRLANPAFPGRIYRSFAFGDLLSLHMLDTRLTGRDQQLDYATYFGPAGFDTAAFAADLADPARQLLGTRQSDWLAGQLARSATTWDLLGQQVLMGRMNIPAPLVLGQISFSDYSALVVQAQTAPGTLTPEQLEILAQPAIPYNLDAWDGYAVARETVLETARALDKNLVVLAGDTHNAWASDLATAGGVAVGVEFATPGVSSPGLEEYFPTEDPLLVAAGLADIIAPLQYANTHQRGYMLVTATHEACEAEWLFVDTVKSQTYQPVQGPILRTLPGAGNRRIVPA
ncbi:MAG: alkaline phosphatase [Hydrogenophilales bacterium 16-64-46]|nr:MAG: alkaline phosphatase [Hydrogenophilales bacterium 16-64-46]OZA37332.1 MAG: alkaline phosphatase [Hydrogenophilales bacterium 17-64-34]HQT00652.1 alkaline phosphatase D family protein [Thiobacillus sp.]